jgi:hypothetical protein
MTDEGAITLHVIEAPLRDVMSDVARFHKQHRTFGGMLLRAGRIVVLKVDNRSAYVVARGPAGVEYDQISLDSATRDKLNIKANCTASFTIKKANLLHEFLWAWNATDAMPRVAARLGAISVVLGIIGLLLGGLSLYLTIASARPFTPPVTTSPSKERQHDPPPPALANHPRPAAAQGKPVAAACG